ncbi:hypothetical protein LZB55_08995, partial [Campylobacter lari]|nr:hypothetical protein [Campylobacter lari]
MQAEVPAVDRAQLLGMMDMGMKHDMGGGGHDMAGMSGMDHGAAPAAAGAMAGMNHGAMPGMDHGGAHGSGAGQGGIVE